MSKKILIFLLTMIVSAFVFYRVEASQEVENKEVVHTSNSVETLNNKESNPPKETDPFLSAVDLKQYEMILVNHAHIFKDEQLPEEKGTLDNVYQVYQDVEPAYKKMKQAAAKKGIELVIVSTYRSVSYQETVYQESLNEKLNAGLKEEEAKKETDLYIAKPGTSEHHTGLAIDLIDTKWQATNKGLVDDFYETEAGKWLDEHCAEYGFIIRYPKGKEEITKINYEPWHLRYVGIDNAKYIMEHKLSLEEFVSLVEKEQNEKK